MFKEKNTFCCMPKSWIAVFMSYHGVNFGATLLIPCLLALTQSPTNAILEKIEKGRKNSDVMNNASNAENASFLPYFHCFQPSNIHTVCDASQCVYIGVHGPSERGEKSKICVLR